MKYLCMVEALNRTKSEYLFTYDFDAQPTENMLVHCETRFGGMYGKITEWVKMPTGKADQEKLVKMMVRFDTGITLPLKAIDTVYEVKYGTANDDNM